MIKQNLLKILFILPCVLALTYPLVHIWVVFPVYEQHLIENTEDDAIRVANHIISSFGLGEGEVSRDSLSPRFAKEMDRVCRDFELEKLKVFSPSGEIVFSTNRSDIGNFNVHPYFAEVVAKGRNLTKFVSKDALTMEGRLVKADVVETYIPILGSGSFGGALEIYFDITKRNEAMKSSSLYLSSLPFGLMLITLLSVTLIVVKTGKSGQLEIFSLPKILQSPVVLLLSSTLAIFAAEAVIMGILSMLPPLDILSTAILDAVLLVMIVAPAIYFFFLQPLFSFMAEQKRVKERLEELSLTDDMTGLLNRRGFLVFAEKLVSSAKRNDSFILLLFADLNDLKNINDTLGHHQGDLIIQETAAILREVFRESDLLGRIGGDEFAVCAVTSDAETAPAAILDRLRRAIKEHNAIVNRPFPFSLSISMGAVVSRASEIRSIEEELSEADRLMYKDKERYRQARIIN